MCPAGRDGENTPAEFYFRHIKSRGGHKVAFVATTHKIAYIPFILIQNKVAYDEGRVGWHEETLLRRMLERTPNTYDTLNSKTYDTAS